MSTILAVDDEKEIVDLIEIYLKNEGYEVVTCNNGEQALKILDSQQIHLAILDIMMPGISGIDVCKKIRETSNIPIIMLSAKSGDMDKVLGLATGADDYMTKPFNPLELIARIKSQLRRYFHLSGVVQEENSLLSVNGLTIDKKGHRVSIYGKNVELTPTEFDILSLLAGNQGKVFSAEEIFENVWKEKYFESNNTVMVHIRKIREKIEENPRKPKFIQTVWGVGYKIE